MKCDVCGATNPAFCAHVLLPGTVTEIWLVTRGAYSDQETIAACRTEAEAKTLQERLDAISPGFNDPEPVPLVGADVALAALGSFHYGVGIDALDGTETWRRADFSLTCDPEDDPGETDHEAARVTVGYKGRRYIAASSRRSYEVALKAARDKRAEWLDRQAHP